MKRSGESAIGAHWWRLGPRLRLDPNPSAVGAPFRDFGLDGLRSKFWQLSVMPASEIALEPADLHFQICGA